MINTLLFHEVKDISVNHSDISIDNFKYLIKKLVEKKAHVSSLEKLSNKVSKDKLFHVITFDDGSISDYSIAFPILIKNAFSATFYIITDMVGKNGYMSWDNILEMSNYGMEIGSHSISHPNFTLLNNEKKYEELNKSKLILEDKLGKSISSFSVPNGAFDKSVFKISFEIGYKNVSISKPGLNKSPIKDNSIILRNAFNKTMNQNSINNILYPSFTKICLDSLNYSLRDLIKKSLGMNNYEKVRSLFYK